MRYAILLTAALLAGCSTIPSMRYCDKVNYTRTGNVVHIDADCRAPIGFGG